MRVLLVFHGRLPAPGRPQSGGSLRAWHHGEALRAAGHEVLYLTRDQDAVEGGPPVYSSPRHLRELARAAAPDVILCVQPEEAPALVGLAPLCVDLYAPRLLEAAFEQALPEEAVNTLRAIAAADHLLFSNPRQRWMYLGVLALAGVDLRQAVGDVVPLVAPEGPPRRLPKEPLLVMAGVAWPWQDPVEALRRTLLHLERRRRGKLLLIGGKPILGRTQTLDLSAALPPSPRLKVEGPMAYDALLHTLAGCTVGFDLMAPNPERELALSFRQMDALGCGLPLLTQGHHALSDTLREADAAWVLDDLGGLEQALDEILDQPEQVTRRGAQARALAQTHFSRDQAEAPLLRWVAAPAQLPRPQAPLLDAAALTAALAESRQAQRAAEALRAQAEQERDEKREEVGRLNQQLAELSGSVAHLSRAVDEVAGFRRETVRVLGARSVAAEDEAELLSRELADTRADLAKKDAELRALRREQERLNDAVAAAQDEAQAAGQRLLEQGRAQDRLRQELRALREAVARGPLAWLRK